MNTAAMQLRTVQVSEADGIFSVMLNRPEKRNAISQELIDDLLRALDAADRSSSQILMVTGAGKAFCAGLDLENLRAITRSSTEENLKDSEKMARFFRALYNFRKPSIAAVNGAAIAGGCAIATLCDFTLASTEAKFGYTEVRIGFVPAIVSTFLVRQVGEKRARDLLISGRIIGAEEAWRMGLVNEVVEPRKLAGRARELALSLMENSPTSMMGTKKLLSESANRELDTQLQAAIEQNAQVRTTEDFREGVTAFLEKRKPRWSR